MSRTISSKNSRKKYGNLYYKLSFSKNKNKFVKQKPNKNWSLLNTRNHYRNGIKEFRVLKESDKTINAWKEIKYFG
jgi:hypothetical protein